MKKRVIILLFVVLITIIIAGLIINTLKKQDKALQGELAELSPQPQDLSVFVLPAVPILSIISPENKTYPSTTILLNYSVKNEVDTIWYNLDNTENKTITAPLLFTVSEGSHTLYLYANNTQGTSAKNITFTFKKSEGPGNGGGNGNGNGWGVSPKEENKTCQQSWFCESWSTCMDNLQNRTCTDINYCEEPYTKTETRACTLEEPKIPKKSYWWIWLLIILAILLIILYKLKKSKKPIKQKKHSKVKSRKSKKRH